MGMEINPDAFYSLPEIAEGLKVLSVFALREWIKKGKLKATKMGRAYIVRGQDLLDTIEERRKGERS